MKNTIILATGKEITAKLKEGDRLVTPAALYNNGQMGIGIFFNNNEGKRVGSFWGLLLPHLPIVCFRAMKILEQLNYFNEDNCTFCDCWYAAIRNPNKHDEKYANKIKNLLGKDKLASILNTPMKESEINSLLVNLTRVNNSLHEHSFLEVEREMNAGFFPKTEIVEKYLKNELITNSAPSFEDVMEFNKNIWPLFREKFVNGEFTRQDALNFLRI